MAIARNPDYTDPEIELTPREMSELLEAGRPFDVSISSNGIRTTIKHKLTGKLIPGVRSATIQFLPREVVTAELSVDVLYVETTAKAYFSAEQSRRNWAIAWGFASGILAAATFLLVSS